MSDKISIAALLAAEVNPSEIFGEPDRVFYDDVDLKTATSAEVNLLIEKFGG